VLRINSFDVIIGTVYFTKRTVVSLFLLRIHVKLFKKRVID